jgi:hypothetical protein
MLEATASVASETNTIGKRRGVVSHVLEKIGGWVP